MSSLGGALLLLLAGPMLLSPQAIAYIIPSQMVRPPVANVVTCRPGQVVVMLQEVVCLSPAFCRLQARPHCAASAPQLPTQLQYSQAPVNRVPDAQPKVFPAQQPVAQPQLQQQAPSANVVETRAESPEEGPLSPPCLTVYEKSCSAGQTCSVVPVADCSSSNRPDGPTQALPANSQCSAVQYVMECRDQQDPRCQVVAQLLDCVQEQAASNASSSVSQCLEGVVERCSSIGCTSMMQTCGNGSSSLDTTDTGGDLGNLPNSTLPDLPDVEVVKGTESNATQIEESPYPSGPPQPKETIVEVKGNDLQIEMDVKASDPHGSSAPGATVISSELLNDQPCPADLSSYLCTDSMDQVCRSVPIEMCNVISLESCTATPMPQSEQICHTVLNKKCSNMAVVQAEQNAALACSPRTVSVCSTSYSIQELTSSSLSCVNLADIDCQTTASGQKNCSQVSRQQCEHFPRTEPVPYPVTQCHNASVMECMQLRRDNLGNVVERVVVSAAEEAILCEDQADKVCGLQISTNLDIDQCLSESLPSCTMGSQSSCDRVSKKKCRSYHDSSTMQCIDSSSHL